MTAAASTAQITEPCDGASQLKIHDIHRFKRCIFFCFFFALLIFSDGNTWHDAELLHPRLRVLKNNSDESAGVRTDAGESYDPKKHLWTIHSVDLQLWEAGQFRFEIPLQRFHSKAKIRYNVTSNCDIACNHGVITHELDDDGDFVCVAIIELEWSLLAQAFKEAELSHSDSSASSRFETSSSTAIGLED